MATKESLERELQMRVVINADSEIILDEEMKKVMGWEPGDIILTDYVGSEEQLVLQKLTKVNLVQENGVVKVAEEELEYLAVSAPVELYATYYESSGALILDPVSKNCAICGKQTGSIKFADKYFCSCCCEYLTILSKMKEEKEARIGVSY